MSDAQHVQLHAVRAQSHAGASKKAPTRDAYARPDAHRASPHGPFQGLLVLPRTLLCAHHRAPVPPIPSEPYIRPCHPHPRQEAGEFVLHHRGAVDRAVGCALRGWRGLQWCRGNLCIWWSAWSEVEGLLSLKIVNHDKWWAEHEHKFKDGREFRDKALVFQSPV